MIQVARGHLVNKTAQTKRKLNEERQRERERGGGGEALRNFRASAAGPQGDGSVMTLSYKCNHNICQCHGGRLGCVLRLSLLGKYALNFFGGLDLDCWSIIKFHCNQ